MPTITISIDDEEKRLLQKRAKKNLMTLKEQVEDIIRKSAVRMKNGRRTRRFKTKDKLVRAFSRHPSGRKRKK